MKNLIRFLCFLLLSCQPLLAQDETPDAQREAKGRVAWFVCTNLPDGLENPVSVMSGKDISQVTLSRRSPSEPVKVPADGILRIVRKVENPKDPGKPAYLTLAQAQIPDGMSKALIILLPTVENPEGLLFQTKVQDLATFKSGDWLYLNLTNLRMGVELGKTSMEVKPGELKIYNPPAHTEPVNMPLRYSYYHPTKQKWKMLTSTTVAMYSTRREICIFSWDPRFNRVSCLAITFPTAL